MARDQIIFEYKSMVDGLQHAVTNWRGKTELTQSDIDRMLAVLKLLEGDAHVKTS